MPVIERLYRSLNFIIFFCISYVRHGLENYEEFREGIKIIPQNDCSVRPHNLPHFRLVMEVTRKSA